MTKYAVKIVGMIVHLAKRGETVALCGRDISETTPRGWITQECFACNKKAEGSDG